MTNFNKLVSLTVLLVILCVASLASAATAPDISADAAIVIDAKTNDILYEKNIDKREYPASMTKIMTCVLTLENGNLNRIVEVSANAANVECTRLHPGYQVRMQDMLKQMMLISDNGCATAIGESLAGGDINYFAELMNRRAESLGMTSTHFVNANGMPDYNHYTTARDMAKLARHAFSLPEFRTIVGTNTCNIYYIQPAGHAEYCENTNELLRIYSGCVGGKTGWTNAARGCLTVAANRDGRELIAIVMHSNNDETRFSEAAALLDYGFIKEVML